jgi:carboxypeptidase C (cathepsin A)
MFYVAYTRDDAQDLAKRPITFAFNGGPGSSSVWLHMGALGPKRVEMGPDGEQPKPPYRLLDNEDTALEFTDLVFIDPVTTGFSRAAPGEQDKQFHGFDGDLDSMAEFVRLYLTRFERWRSPKFLAGES